MTGTEKGLRADRRSVAAHAEQIARLVAPEAVLPRDIHAPPCSPSGRNWRKPPPPSWLQLGLRS